MLFNLFRLIITIISIIGIFFIYEDINIEIIKKQIQSIGFFTFVNAYLISFVGMILLFLRFSLLVNFLNISFFHKIFIVFNSNLLNLIPIPFFTELIKIKDLKLTAGIENSIFIVFVEKFASILCYLLIIITSLAWVFFEKNFMFIFIFLFVLFLYFLNKKKYNLPYFSYVFQRLGIFFPNFNYIFLNIIFFSIAIQITSMCVSLYLFNEIIILDLENLSIFITTIFITNFISSLPISFGGMGIRDLVYLLIGPTMLAISKEVSLSISISLNLIIIFNHINSFLISSLSFFFIKIFKINAIKKK